MMRTMTYKDYAARIEYSDEDACFIGHIAGIFAFAQAVIFSRVNLHRKASWVKTTNKKRTDKRRSC
jgi:predicted HicB family RNase H-like nuclease